MQTKPIPDYITSQGLPESIFHSFFSSIEYTDTCWIWKGLVSWRGYGRINWRVNKTFRSMGAHRLSWMIHIGAIPDGLFVCHECDNPPCVNPAHLWTGTHADNMQDMLRKGREVRNPIHGEDHYCAKLTWKEVRQIRAEHIPWKMSYSMLAEKYGVHLATIQGVIQRRYWKENEKC